MIVVICFKVHRTQGVSKSVRTLFWKITKPHKPFQSKSGGLQFLGAQSLRDYWLGLSILELPAQPIVIWGHALAGWQPARPVLHFCAKYPFIFLRHVLRRQVILTFSFKCLGCSGEHLQNMCQSDFVRSLLNNQT